MRQQRQRLAHRPAQALGMRRGLHALRRAHEQIVAAGRAQAPQRIADRRLRQVELARHGGDAALLQQALEDHQQVEIDVAQFRHGAPLFTKVIATIFAFP
ncbi:hypothetical protein NB2BOR_A37020 [Bordetella parapertussis]|nr:hypothetical protein NB2BOR_A37020 [Bordetella parapertussis]